ncbi:MAG: hypothetical protein ACYDAO_04540 [Thermoplasmataceae archaeon]
MEDQSKNDLLKPMLDQLKLDIKGVMLLSGKNQEISRLDIINKMIEDDPDVRDFFSIISQGRNQRFIELLITGVGQFITASILFIIGSLLLFPSLTSKFSASSFLKFYSSGIVYYGKISGFLYVSAVLSFLFSIFLLISAFYTMRVARNSFHMFTK